MAGGEVDGANSSLRSFIKLFLLFQIIVIQKEPDHPSFLIDIISKGTFSSKKEPIGKVWYIAFQRVCNDTKYIGNEFKHNFHKKKHKIIVRTVS